MGADKAVRLSSHYERAQLALVLLFRSFEGLSLRRIFDLIFFLLDELYQMNQFLRFVGLQILEDYVEGEGYVCRGLDQSWS
jgi:hypothetical protein